MRARPTVRRNASCSTYFGPRTSESRPAANRYWMSICHIRSWAWTYPRAKNRSWFVVAKMCGTPHVSRRTVTSPSRPRIRNSSIAGWFAPPATVHTPPFGFSRSPRGGSGPRGIERRTTRTAATATETVSLTTRRDLKQRPSDDYRCTLEIGFHLGPWSASGPRGPATPEVGARDEDEARRDEREGTDRPELDGFLEGEEPAHRGDRGRDLAHEVQADRADAPEEREVDREPEGGRGQGEVQEGRDSPGVEHGPPAALKGEGERVEDPRACEGLPADKREDVHPVPGPPDEDGAERPRDDGARDQELGHSRDVQPSRVERHDQDNPGETEGEAEDPAGADALVLQEGAAEHGRTDGVHADEDRGETGGGVLLADEQKGVVARDVEHRGDRDRGPLNATPWEDRPFVAGRRDPEHHEAGDVEPEGDEEDRTEALEPERDEDEGGPPQDSEEEKEAEVRHPDREGARGT